MTSAYAAWTYRERKLYINDPSVIDGVQAKYVFTLLNGMAADGKDLRFSDTSGTALSYYIESISGTTFTVWIRLPAVATYIYMYWGNASATSESSGEDTFDFFEHFEGDLSQWSYGGTGSFTQSNSLLSSSTTNSIMRSSVTFGQNTICETFLCHNDGSLVMFGFRDFSTTYTAAWQGTRGTNHNDFRYNSNGAGSKITDDGVNRGGGVSYTYGVAYLADSIKYYIDGTLRTTHTENVPTGNLPVCFYQPTTIIFYADWIRVRKYVETEPTFVLEIYPDWLYRQIKINISYPTTTDGIQAVMEIYVVDGMQSGGQDIRFSDMYGSDLPYWIESLVNGIMTVWIKLPADDTYIYFYYGNSAATSESSGDNTFEIFDDFTTADHDKWTFPAHYDVTNGILHVYSQNNGDLGVACKTVIPNDVVIGALVKTAHTGVVAGCYERPISLNAATAEMYFECCGGGTSITNYISPNSNATSVTGWAAATYYKIEFCRRYDLSRLEYSGGIFSNSTYYSTEDLTLYLRVVSSTSTKAEIWIDYIYIRKYGDGDPELYFDFSDWKVDYYSIKVSNPSSTSGVQAKIKLSLLHGMQADGDDIRFTEWYGNLLPYHIESIIDNEFTIWVKLPADDYNIYVHWGNENATAVSSADDTYELYDHFESQRTDLWSIYGAQWMTDSVIHIGGASNSAIESIATFPINTIWEAKLYHPTNCDSVFGFLTISNNYRSAWHGEGATNNDYVSNQDSSGSAIADDLVRYGTVYHTYKVIRTSTNTYYYCDDVLRQTLTTHIYTGNLNADFYVTANHGQIAVDWVRVRKYDSTLPTLTIVYELSVLDPESVDVSSSIEGSYVQLTATFPHKYLPVENSKIYHHISGFDDVSYTIFYGKVVTRTPGFGSCGDSVQLTAASPAIALANQPIRMTMLSWEAGVSSITVSETLDYLTYETDLLKGNYVNVNRPYKRIIFDEKITKFEAAKQLFTYFDCIINFRFTDPHAELIDAVPAGIIDQPNPYGFSLPSPITFSYPDATIVDNLTLEKQQDEVYNKVTVYGTITSTGAYTACSACTKAVYLGEEIAKEYVVNDNSLEEKVSTALAESIKWLLYFNTKRATVRFRVKNRVGLVLYQRIKFGAGYPEEITALTNQTQFDFVYTRDPTTNDAYAPIDVSGVPTPLWLRISALKYHGDHSDEYIDYDAVTDFVVYGYGDEELPAAYEDYVNPGMMKPTINDTTSQAQSIVDSTISQKATPIYGSVSLVTDANNADVLLDSGKVAQCKTVTTTTLNKRVLVVPDNNGNFYICDPG